jgi:hypothetical protein
VYHGPYSSDDDYVNVNSGSEIIEYADGQRLPNGHWPWKECVHEEHMHYSSPVYGFAYQHTGWPKNNPKEFTEGTMSALYLPKSLPSVPSSSWDSGLLIQLMDQLDLNTNDAVLLYSGVLQAVPLLGGALKFNKIMRSVWDHVSKSMRRKPFTTVIKDLIQADFIDRFVIGPTLDDARKFQDATDYVLRVIQTARERSAHHFALQAESSKILSEKTGTVSYGQGPMCTIYGNTSVRTSTTSKAFMLLEAKYDIDAIDPLRVWAQRVGLTRPLDSVWDLVPFSFVVDYFTRAGDFVSALSDEMSTVEGLQGRITRIHDLWGTLYNVSEGKCVGTRMTNLNIREYSRVYSTQQYLSTASVRSSRFERFRIRNPYATLLSAQRKEDYLSINLDLSTTRKRTIAELLIQAKL